jgi:hypothetical protein
MIFQKYFEKFKRFHFEFKHLTILFLVLLLFQLIISIVNRSSVTTFLSNTQEWYQKDAAEKIANLTATSLELTIESFDSRREISEEDKARIIQSFNIIFSQQSLQHNIKELCILASRRDTLYKIDEGKELFSFLNDEKIHQPVEDYDNSSVVLIYEKLRKKLSSEEQIISFSDSANNLHVFVPFVIEGEELGAVYMKNNPDFSSLSDQLIARQDETTIIYISLILLGFISMYFISSYSVKERDEAQNRLLAEHEENLKKQFNYEKELAFTKRIYHTHHKAEKIMGFIKQDLNKLNTENIETINYRVTKYSNFISRVIYDMKWFDPPVQTIRGPMYNTNLNEVLKFIVDNIFLRVSKLTDNLSFNFIIDNELPEVHVNEFVIWELFEPLIQNAIEHGGPGNLKIQIKTFYDKVNSTSVVHIIDNGKGIDKSLLLKNADGIENIFLENMSTKSNTGKESGYGCYIAYQIARRCGWNLSVTNNIESGATFIVSIKNY